MTKHILNVFKKYAVFSGRAGRAEYWSFFLFNLISLLFVAFAGTALNKLDAFAWTYAFLVACPTVAVLVRRLHDVEKGEQWIALGAIPIIGQLWLLIYLTQEGTLGDNIYGADPRMERTEPEQAKPVDIKDYIKNQLGAGVSKSDIRSALITSGWGAEYVDGLIAKLTSTDG